MTSTLKGLAQSCDGPPESREQAIKRFFEEAKAIKSGKPKNFELVVIEIDPPTVEQLKQLAQKPERADL